MELIILSIRGAKRSLNQQPRTHSASGRRPGLAGHASHLLLWPKRRFMRARDSPHVPHLLLLLLLLQAKKRCSRCTVRTLRRIKIGGIEADRVGGPPNAQATARLPLSCWAGHAGARIHASPRPYSRTSTSLRALLPPSMSINVHQRALDP
jgi:hypothetical protein